MGDDFLYKAALKIALEQYFDIVCRKEMNIAKIYDKFKLDMSEAADMCFPEHNVEVNLWSKEKGYFLHDDVLVDDYDEYMENATVPEGVPENFLKHYKDDYDTYHGYIHCDEEFYNNALKGCTEKVRPDLAELVNVGKFTRGKEIYRATLTANGYLNPKWLELMVDLGNFMMKEYDGILSIDKRSNFIDISEIKKEMEKRKEEVYLTNMQLKSLN